jgi:hypothetical protein
VLKKLGYSEVACGLWIDRVVGDVFVVDAVWGFEME